MTEAKPIRPLYEFPSSDSFDRDDVKVVIKGVHVVPRSRTTWAVKKGGEHAITKIFRSRDAAIEYAKEVSSSTKSTLYVHLKSGKVRQYND